ncbi:MAG: NUDIX hydrolase [Acidimicrobiia bacterium]
MLDRVHRAVLQLFRRLPRRARLAVVHTVAPSYSVGAMCIVRRADGRILLVRHTYRRRWGVPGGLLNRKEDPWHAGRREAREEVGLDIDLIGQPAVVVEPRSRRIDLVFRAQPVREADADLATPSSPEIMECRWFALDDLPDLQHETAGALNVLTKTFGDW